MHHVLKLATLTTVLALSVGACTTAETAGDDGGNEATARAEVEAGSTGAERRPGSTDVMVFEPVPDAGGTLVIGQVEEPETLYLYGGAATTGAQVLGSLYDGPIESLDYDFQPVILDALPKLEREGSGATLRTVSVEAGETYVDPGSGQVTTASEAVDGLPQLTVRFTLRRGLTWQDGTTITADDSVFSRQLACDPDTGGSKVFCDRTAHYVSIDDRTVEWQGLPGFADRTALTSFYTPLPRHQLSDATGRPMSEMTAAEINADETFARRPYSYGPFKIEAWLSGERIVLVRNEHYWRKGEGLPFLDEVAFVFPGDSRALLAALVSGEVDVVTQDGLEITQFDELEQAAAYGRLVPYYVPGAAWEHIDFNLNPSDDRVAFGACKAIRRAIALGTDRAAMVGEIQKGKTKVLDTFLPEGHWAHPDAADLVTYPYDPEKARQMLDDLGFRDADADGVREAQTDIVCTIVDPSGDMVAKTIPADTSLEMTLNTTSGSEMRQQTTLLFQQNMKDIGVAIDLAYVAADVLLDAGRDGAVTARRYDLAEFAWLTGVQPPVDLYTCGRIPSAANDWAGQNSTGWCLPEYDGLGLLAETALDRTDAIPLYVRAQALFAESLPVVPLFARVKVMGTSPRLVNFRPNATATSETWNIETWGLTAE